MRRPSAGGHWLWRNLKPQHRLHRREGNPLKFMVTRTIACCAGSIGLWMGLIDSAPAEDIGSVIALPIAPFVVPMTVFPTYNSPDVLTQRNDNNRSGTSFVSSVNQTKVKNFRKLAELTVAGVVTAQPLYSHSSMVRGKLQPVLIVATSTNDVYAFPPSGSAKDPLWHVNLGAPLSAKSVNDPKKNWCKEPEPGVTSAVQEPSPNGVSEPLIGIEATPVIDLHNNQVLVGFKTDEGDQHLAALDLNDGQVKRQVKVPSDTSDWGEWHRNRASLLLVDGVVYLAFSGLCEGPQNPHQIHGSISAFDAVSLEEVGSFLVTPDTDGGGIWQASTGLAADTAGNLYFSTGNRRLGKDQLAFNSATHTLSNSVIRVGTKKGPPDRPGLPYSLKMSVEDYFTPYRKILEDLYDLDLAASGVLLIPGTRYLAAAGKEGIIYILDRDHLGNYDNAGPAWDVASVMALGCQLHKDALDDRQFDDVFQKFQAGVNQYEHDDYMISDWAHWPHIHGTPVFARLGGQAFMFVWPEKDVLKRYRWQDDVQGFDPLSVQGAEVAPPYFDVCPPRPTCPAPPPPHCGHPGTNGMPGGMLSVNIDPNGSGLGVVFASIKHCGEAGLKPCDQSQDDGILRAYDPFTMRQIWSNCESSSNCESYYFAKYVPPTIANGLVFLATGSGKVLIYGP
jgi:hypothetical protein